jgi:membrane associated rhomboid family serine protease
MIILPYSTALTLTRPPVVTYSVVFICSLMFFIQIGNYEFTESMMYFPDTWNPVKMLTCGLVHANWPHILGNMIFFLAFASALELLIGSKLRYVWIMIFISLVTGASYSLIEITRVNPLPTLGFSGVVMGVIGLSAYLMPQARVRVFFWYWFAWKTFYVKAWFLAVAYIGLDTWTMLFANNYGGINIVAHVAGGFAGYLYGFFWLKDRREEIKSELAVEVEVMEVKRKHGKIRAEALRYRKTIDHQKTLKQAKQDEDKFMGSLYQMVNTHRDSDAVLFYLNRYGLETHTYELEKFYDQINNWGPSRTLLCLGRIIIEKLDKEKRYGKAIVYIEKCQNISPQFLISDIGRVLFYAEMAIDTHKIDVAKNLLINPSKRYGSLIDPDQCNHLLQKL